MWRAGRLTPTNEGMRTGVAPGVWSCNAPVMSGAFFVSAVALMADDVALPVVLRMQSAPPLLISAPCLSIRPRSAGCLPDSIVMPCLAAPVAGGQFRQEEKRHETE